MRRFILASIILCSCSEPEFREQSPSSLQSADALPLPAPVNANASGNDDAGRVKPGILTPTPDLGPESVSAPEPITGTYLACSDILDSSAAPNEIKTTIGCRLEDYDGNHFYAQAVHATAKYTVEAEERDGIRVAPRDIQAGERDFDVIIEYRGASLTDSKGAAFASRIGVKLLDLSTNQVVSQVESPAATVITHSLSGVWSKDESVERSYLETTSLLTWAVDDQQTYTWDGADKHCGTLNYGQRRRWRLPTLDELKASVKSGLGQTFAEADEMGILSGRTDSYWSATVGLNNQAYSINLKDANHGYLLAEYATQLSVICVRDKGYRDYEAYK